MSSARRTEYLTALGLDAWTLRVPPVEPAERTASAPPREAPREAAYDWPQLRERVAGCTRCPLSATRTQTVFGVGNLQADWMVVGEAPGAEEDQRGEPFVGRAGQLLNSMLRAIGLEREQVYIANVLKCRPPHNRDPLPGESAECLPFLERQGRI
jgi:uracil-DNA glycosylase